MRTPSAALAWEFWQRHRARLIIIVSLLGAFVLVYPKLCALDGMDPSNDNCLGRLDRFQGPVSLLKVINILYFLFLWCGPMMAQLLSLLVVIWMATFTEFDPRTKEVLKFPDRMFTLPISTPFLFWRLALGGMAAIGLLYEGWVRLVLMPHLDVPPLRLDCLSWIALLALAQGITWALAAWPFTRMLVLMGAIFGAFACVDAGWLNHFTWTLVWLLGWALGVAGLQKTRQGEWQGLTWRPAARATLRGPKQFASPAHAQLWFECRRSNIVWLITVGASFVAVVGCLAAHVFYNWPATEDAQLAVPALLGGVVLLVHFCFGLSPGRTDRFFQTDQSFMLVRPLTSGQFVMPMWKSAAISALLSWLAVLAATSVIVLLRPLKPAWLPIFSAKKIAAVAGLIVLTWRLGVVNLCFVLPGKRWLASMPVWLLYLLGLVVFMVKMLLLNDAYWGEFLRVLPALLLFLVAVKFFLAFMAFGASLKRRLIEPHFVETYLVVWLLLVGAMIAAAMILVHPDSKWIFSTVLSVILLVPLARMGFCPIALARQRHG